MGPCEIQRLSRSFRLPRFRRTGFRLMGFRLTGFRLMRFRLTGFRLMGFRLTRFRLTGFRLMVFRLTGFRLTGFMLTASLLGGRRFPPPTIWRPMAFLYEMNCADHLAPELKHDVHLINVFICFCCSRRRCASSCQSPLFLLQSVLCLFWFCVRLPEPDPGRP